MNQVPFLKGGTFSFKDRTIQTTRVCISRSRQQSKDERDKVSKSEGGLKLGQQ